jgi:hypothetical protein
MVWPQAECVDARSPWHFLFLLHLGRSDMSPILDLIIAGDIISLASAVGFCFGVREIRKLRSDLEDIAADRAEQLNTAKQMQTHSVCSKCHRLVARYEIVDNKAVCLNCLNGNL